MQDMVIKGTGNSRFLKSVENFLDLFPNYEAFAAAFAAGILPVDFNGINPDGITQMGTPYAKSAVMTDETAALFGLDETAVPDDVFRWIAEWGQSTWKLLAEYKTAGAYTFVVPDDVDELGVLMIGGGGSGGAASGQTNTTLWSAFATGGGSGQFGNIVFRKQDGQFTTGEEIPVVVGAGGKGVTIGDGNASGNAGGTSSFKTNTLAGGPGGNGFQYGGSGGAPSGGMGQSSDGNAVPDNLPAPYGLAPYYPTTTGDAILLPTRPNNTAFGARNRFDENDAHVYCGAGGLARRYYSSGSYTSTVQSVITRTKGSAGAGAAQTSVGNSATAPGDGGGAVVGNYNFSITSGDGADGLVLVYGRKVV